MTFTTSTLDAFFAARERHVRQYLLTVRTDCPEVVPPALLRSKAVQPVVRPVTIHPPRSRCGCGRVKQRHLERCAHCQFLGQSTTRRRYVSSPRKVSHAA